MASCSSGASTNGSTTTDPAKPKIALGAVVADAELSGEAQRIPINQQQSILLAAGDAKSGTKLQVREVLNVDAHVGGVTVRDKVLDIAVRSGKLLGKIKVLYNVPNPPPGAPTPTAGELDRATGKWTRIAGTVYDANNERLEVPLTKSAAIGRLEWDWTNAIDGAATAASALVAQAEGTDPQCTGEDDVNNRYNVVVSTVASVAWCAGVEKDSGDVLRVRNRGRLPVAIVASSGFSISAPVSGPYAFVDELAGLLASNHAWPMPAGKAVQVIAPGSELTLSFPKGQPSAEVSAEVDAYSQQVAALAVAAEVATAIFAGQGMPTPALLSNDGQVRTSLFGKLTSTQCSDDFGPVAQDVRRSADELAKFVGSVVTGCIGNNILQELARTQPAATSQQRDNFAPSDPAQIPGDFADQIAAAVAPTIDDLTQRLGLPQLSKVVMEQRAPTTTATTPPPTRPVTTAPVPDTTAVTTPVTSTPVTTETPTVPTSASPVVTTPVTTPDTTIAPPATTTATTPPPTTVPPTEPTTTTTAVAPTTPTSVLSTLSEPSSAQFLCSGKGSSVTQPFVVPAGTTELDSVTIATDGVFTADLEIRSGDERLRSPNLVATGSTAKANLHQLPVVAGTQLTVVITNVRHSVDKLVPIRFTTTDVIAGINATISNRCPTAVTALTLTDLAMEIFGR